MRVLVPFAALLLVASPLHAQTYKWVDEKGVTNYSNKPPAGRLAQAKVVEDRLSVIGDPDLAEAADKLRAREERRAERAQAEWVQRQRAAPPMAAAATAYAAYDDCAYADCGYGGSFYPAYYGGYRRHFPGKFPPRPAHRPRPAPLLGARAAPLR